MNFFSNQHLKKITKASFALVLASTFTLSSITFADEIDTETINKYETVDLQELQSQLENTQDEVPSLIPGDFFYFAKIAFEKIKLAFTFDQAKEAELMATYASERLAEAAALYGEGKEAEAIEVIQTAIKYIEDSQAIIDEESSTSLDEADSTVADNEEAVTEDINQDDQTSDTETPVIDNETEEAQGEFAEAENMLRHNIIALTAAMKHVGNDQARASLQKNIDKTYAKIAKKIEKLEKKYGKNELINNENSEGTEKPSHNEEPAIAPTPNVTTENTKATSAPATEENNTTITAPIVSDSVNITNPPAPARVKQGKGIAKNQVNKQEKKAVGNAKERGNSENAHQKNQQQKGNNKEQ